MQQQKGFTLIELVMVIVILGILAAFALPRFADLGTNARTSVIQGAAGSVKSAAAIAHSKWLADGDTGAVTLTLDGTSVPMSSTGYPTKFAGIFAAAQLETTQFTSAASSISLLNNGSTVPNCSFDYTDATGQVSNLVTTCK